MMASLRAQLATALLSALLCTVATNAGAEELGGPKNPWRGSSISYEHITSAISLDRSHDLTYNPLYAHSLGLSPQWHFAELFVASLSLSMEQELTRADDTNRAYDVVFSDLMLRFSPEKSLYTEENTGIRLGAGLGLQFPTSKASQAQTLMVGVTPSVNLSKRFDLLKGFTVRYGATLGLNWHRYTTAQRDAPTIMGCARSSSECAPYMNTGYRNTASSISHGPSLSLVPFDDLTLSVSYSLRRAELYDLGDADLSDRNGNKIGLVEFGKDPGARYSQSFRVEAGYKVLDALSLALGLATSYGDLAPDSSYRFPFLNRYSNLYLSATIDADAVLSSLNVGASKKEIAPGT